MKRPAVLLAPLAAVVAPFVGMGAAFAGPTPKPPLAATSSDVTPINGKAAGALGINNKGLVVGWARVSGHTHMVQQPKGGAVQDLGQYSSADTFADAVNNKGEIVGHAIGGSSANKRSIAFRWTTSGGYQSLPAPNGARFSWAEDINNKGQAVVDVTGSLTGDDGAYLWNPGAATGIKLPDLGHGPAYATGINNDGTIVGYAPADASGTVNHVVVWDPDNHAINDLGHGSVDSGAEAVNADGTLVGWSGDHAWAWSDDGTLHWDLGPGHATAVNGEGIAIGYGGDGLSLNVWDVDYDTITPLATGPGINEANAINDKNVIAGEYDYTFATWGPFDPEA